MKHFLVWVAGASLGAACALLVLYYNPLTLERNDDFNGSDDIVFRYELPEQVLRFELGEDARFLGQRTRDSLWEDAVDRTAVLGVSLNDASGKPFAVASRMFVPSPDSDLLRNGIIVGDFTLVTVPQEGTFFLHSESNLWPLIKDTAPVWYLGRSWRGPTQYSPTVGPEPEHAGKVVGLTGIFSGLESTALERYELDAFDPDVGTAAMGGELRVRFTSRRLAEALVEP